VRGTSHSESRIVLGSAAARGRHRPSPTGRASIPRRGAAAGRWRGGEVGGGRGRGSYRDVRFDNGASSGNGSTDAASGSGPSSCQAGGNGLTNCGATAESCCTSLEVSGGTYYRTYTNDGSGPAGEADPATVSSFRCRRSLRPRRTSAAVAWTADSGWGVACRCSIGRSFVLATIDGGTAIDGWCAGHDGSAVGGWQRRTQSGRPAFDGASAKLLG
jgi:hypothetical protein